MAKTKSQIKTELEDQIRGLKQELERSAAGQTNKTLRDRYTAQIDELQQKVSAKEKLIGRIAGAAGKLYLATEDLERVLGDFDGYIREYRSNPRVQAQVEMLRKTLARARQAYRREMP